MLEDDGSWKEHEFTGGETKRETEAMLKQALEVYNQEGRIIDPGEMTVSTLGDLWFADEVEHSPLTTSGRNDYRNVLRQIREHSLGRMKLRDVTVEHLQHFHFHALRHTYASTLVTNGANFKDVQELMGHSDNRITLNTYYCDAPKEQ